jgi:hypothetical protein
MEASDENDLIHSIVLSHRHRNLGKKDDGSMIVWYCTTGHTIKIYLSAKNASSSSYHDPSSSSSSSSSSSWKTNEKKAKPYRLVLCTYVDVSVLSPTGRGYFRREFANGYSFLVSWALISSCHGIRYDNTIQDTGYCLSAGQSLVVVDFFTKEFDPSFVCHPKNSVAGTPRQQSSSWSYPTNPGDRSRQCNAAKASCRGRFLWTT